MTRLRLHDVNLTLQNELEKTFGSDGAKFRAQNDRNYVSRTQSHGHQLVAPGPQPDLRRFGYMGETRLGVYKVVHVKRARIAVREKPFQVVGGLRAYFMPKRRNIAESVHG